MKLKLLLKKHMITLHLDLD